MRTIVGAVALAALLPGAPAVRAEDGTGRIEGSAEVLYRNVSVDGSSRKYAADFDGLESGVRLAHLEAGWLEPGDGRLDWARLEVHGLGGDPFERTRLELGRKDRFELEIDHKKQRFFYDLFELVPDEDGSRWDTERRTADIGLTLHPRENVAVVLEYQDGRRSGSSLSMKDLSRELFRLETPLDQNVKRYTVGADLDLGSIALRLRQTLRRYDNRFDATAENDGGLGSAATALDDYDWRQRDTGGSDWTTLEVRAPFGERVDLRVALHGTFLGGEEVKSRVTVDAEGTQFNGSPLVIAGGYSRADLEGDTTIVDADLGVRLQASLDLHLQYRSLDRDLDGVLLRDLEGTGLPPAAVDVRRDYAIDTLTALLDWRPTRRVALRGGLRTIDRDLARTGFDSLRRNGDYASGDDDTLILGATYRPTDWLRLEGDHEDGDVVQPFTAVAARERAHTRLRAVLTPHDDMQLDLSWRDFEHTNFAEDLRDPGDFWDSRIEGRSWAASFWHRANPRVDYLLRYAEQEVESRVGVIFDPVEPGDSIFDDDNRQIRGRIRLRPAERWELRLEGFRAEAEGEDRLIGDVSGLVIDQPVEQELLSLELAATYAFGTGVKVGMSYRDFEYDDVNDLLDYDGAIFGFWVGSSF